MKDKSLYTNSIWKQKIDQCLNNFDNTVNPRGKEVKEVINGTYKIPMPAFLSIESRNINLAFMFAEAAWILSGSNLLSDITPYMGRYSDFSDDNVFMNGAYGPKITEQLTYLINTIQNDLDTRQAVLTIWRERPGQSKDIPCTISMQVLIRDSKLHLLVNMRSQDIVLGFTYDVFTFSMVAFGIKELLKERGIKVELGNLYLNAGSLHLYSEHYVKSQIWLQDRKVDKSIIETVEGVLNDMNGYEDLINKLREGAENARRKS
jgi:thymidylate synthase